VKRRWGLTLGVLLLWVAAAALAEEEPLSEQVRVLGVVSGVSRQGIGLELTAAGGASATELYLPVDEKTRLERVRSVLELKMDDLVEVDYQRKYRLSDTGEKISLGIVATRIALIRPALAIPKDVREEESRDSLISREDR
jgi:hypothetical protein